MADRAALVAHARRTIAAGSKSFAAASRLFDARTRERAQLLYAWCRACDDIADGQVLGHGASAVQDATARLSRMRMLTAKALAGEETGDLSFDCLGVVAAETGLPHRYAHDLIDGFALDAQEWRPRSEDDLLRYCYHVAGTVGCMMAVVMGVAPDDEAVLDRACDLGIAFQLANIARDISEDDVIDRCYLPVEWLVEVDIPPGEHMKPPFRPRLAVLARRLSGMAERYEASARTGTKALPFRSAWAVLAAAGIYGDIAREVAARGPRAWDRRVTTSNADKLGWVVTAGWQAMRRRSFPDASRDGLWTRGPATL
ncbi:phytoene/squalene synthase family protein [Sphingomonas oryzagri]|uniref:Phytoene/squalene synthase family protein n=1 Tax=Sphingomonas oryzagri TaxID=3042314 RepID=A0ABT6N454_9SPHN|nr:phytoene/squalene synthase family protein [Sphingomonas oryzagri]MDH7639942.1 phytoene/squalene synthase family protein [Sphingomonas oryzagri]